MEQQRKLLERRISLRTAPLVAEVLNSNGQYYPSTRGYMSAYEYLTSMGCVYHMPYVVNLRGAHLHRVTRI